MYCNILYIHKDRTRVHTVKSHLLCGDDTRNLRRVCKERYITCILPTRGGGKYVKRTFPYVQS